MKLKISAFFLFSKFKNRWNTDILAAILNFYKYRNYLFFYPKTIKNWIAEKIDSRFEKLMVFYVRKLCFKKISGCICFRKIALKVVQLPFLQLQRAGSSRPVLSESKPKSSFLYMKMKLNTSIIFLFLKYKNRWNTDILAAISIFCK